MARAKPATPAPAAPSNTEKGRDDMLWSLALAAYENRLKGVRQAKLAAEFLMQIDEQALVRAKTANLNADTAQASASPFTKQKKEPLRRVA